MKVIGIAGPAGSGKSSVARELARRARGVWIDLDRVAWSSYEPGTPTFSALVERFGPGILDASGRVDRSALAERAFADAEAKGALDRIVHPAVGAALARRIAEERRAGRRLLLVEGALLATSADVDRSLFDAMIWLDAPPETRAARLERDRRAAHAARNAEIAPPDDVIRIDTDAPLGEVVDRLRRTIDRVEDRRPD